MINESTFGVGFSDWSISLSAKEPNSIFIFIKNPCLLQHPRFIPDSFPTNILENQISLLEYIFISITDKVIKLHIATSGNNVHSVVTHLHLGFIFRLELAEEWKVNVDWLLFLLFYLRLHNRVT